MPILTQTGSHLIKGPSGYGEADIHHGVINRKGYGALASAGESSYRCHHHRRLQGFSKS